MAQPITDYTDYPCRQNPASTLRNQSLLASVLASVVASPPLPDWSVAQWVAILGAPQASQRVSHFARDRGMTGAAVIERPEVARLLVWVYSTWPGSLRAMAGALAAARQVQATQPADLTGAATHVIDEIRRSRSRRGFRAATGWRAVPVDPAELNAMEPAPQPPHPPTRVADALDWMLGFVEVRLPLALRLGIEADVELFLGWYVDRLAQPAPGQISTMPPSRSLPPSKRLSTRIGDRDMALLLAGPPGSRRCPTERAWQRGMGYWAIVALLSWVRGVEPSPPTAEAREWWSSQLRVLATRHLCAAATAPHLTPDAESRAI